MRAWNGIRIETSICNNDNYEVRKHVLLHLLTYTGNQNTANIPEAKRRLYLPRVCLPRRRASPTVILEQGSSIIRVIQQVRKGIRMPKRRSDEHVRGGGRKPRRQHLYLVLDDWSSGYTVRKIDLLVDSVASYPGRRMIPGGFLGKQRLPPPIMRLEAARGLPMHLVASGSRLLFMQPPIDPAIRLHRRFFPLADVRMLSTTFVPRPTDLLDPIYIPVGDRLFTLHSCHFAVLGPLTHNPQGSWSWQGLPNPPFHRSHVVSYALHPDKLFINTKKHDSVSTFTFNVVGAEGKPEWNKHTYMMMPFTGQGHFDPVLNAFVGLSRVPGSTDLCLVDMDGSLKFSKDKLFSEDNPVETEVGSTLVYMGGRSNFCLVQCISHDETNGNIIAEPNDNKLDGMNDTKLDDQDVSGHSYYLFRLTTFFLKYDKNGDLRIVNLQVQHYNVPEEVTESVLKNPAAFWM